MNTFEASTRSKLPGRLLIATVAIAAIVVFMNYDVANRAYEYASNRPQGSIEYPTFMDRLCFRRIVWIDESTKGEANSATSFEVNLFGVEKVYRKNNRPKKTIPHVDSTD